MNNLHNNQRGIAILFSLGILSVLLVLALFFASSSMTNRKIAENTSRTANARILAESTLNRVINLLQTYADDTGYLYEKPYSYTSSTTAYTNEPANNIHKTDSIENISISETGDVTTTTPYNHATNGISWQFIYHYNDPNGDSDFNPFTDNVGSRDSAKIIGRIAYVLANGNSISVVGCGVDPGDLVKSGVNEVSNTEPRPGVELNEINIQSIDSTTITSAYADILNYTGTGNGFYTGTWRSFSNLFNYLAIPSTETTKRNDFMKWFVIDAQKESEAFWLERVNVNNKIDTDSSDPTNPAKNELYHRFNLARTNWGAVSLSDIIPNTITAGTWPVASDVFNVVAPIGTRDGNGIPWIDNWESTGTSFTSAAARRKQIAANLKDYCDSDHDVTTDTTWSASAPTYTGNEKNPYLNEITVNIEASLTVSGGPLPADYTSSATFNCYIGAEIVNLYGQSGNAKVRLSGVWDYKRIAPNGTTYSSPRTFTDFDVDIAFGAGDLYKSNTEFESTKGPFSSGSPDHATEPSVSEISLIITKAYLITDVWGSDKNADYCKVDSSEKKINPVIASTSTDKTATTWFTFEADDPRQNLNQSDWTFTSVVAATGGTLGAKNSSCNPNPGGAKDAELSTALDVGTFSLSTAFIRDAPMQSPWELGAIHRGAKWETINLKAYDSTAGINPNHGGNDYSGAHGGDANILDQIKMTSNVTSSKKISLMYQGDVATTPKGLLTALFRKLGLRSTYLTPGTASHEPHDDFIKSIVANIKTASAPMKSRATISNISGIWKDSEIHLQEVGGGGAPVDLDRDNDARQEEIIGKIINLTSASPGASQTEYFTVVIIAQTINDVGTPLSTSGITISKVVNGIGLTTINNCKLGQYDQYADEITGEQKIKALIHRDPYTRKCTIISLEYLEE